MKRLTPKQKKFVEAYVAVGQHSYGNGSEAARVAGYKGDGEQLKVQGSKLLTYPHVKREVARFTQAATQRVNITIDKVLNDLEEVRVGALADRKWSAAAKASELQGKYLKMFVDRIEHTVAIEELPDEELDRLIEDATAELATKETQ